jgi:ribosomal protein L40E
LSELGIKYLPKPQTFQLNFVLKKAVKVQTQAVQSSASSLVEKKTEQFKNASTQTSVSKPEKAVSQRSDQSFVLEPKKVPLLINQKYDLLCPTELKISLSGDYVEIRVRCEHPDLYLFSEFRHDRKQWSSFTFLNLKKLLTTKEWPQFSEGCFLDKKYFEDDDSFFDVGVKFFLTSGKPELHELTYVMTKPAGRAQIGIPSTVTSTSSASKVTPVVAKQPESPKLNFKFCGECGARNSTSDKFCGKCGGKV